MDFSTFSGRDALILAVILVAVYLLVSLLRLNQIKRRRKNSAAAQTAPAADTSKASQHVADSVNSASSTEPANASTSPVEALKAGATGAAVSPSGGAHSSSFEEQLFRSSVEAELQNLRSDVAELKAALGQLTASRRVSPQYNEAMMLAQRGMDTQIIADQCAISIGEAELVVALSRNRQEYEDYDSQYDGRE